MFPPPSRVSRRRRGACGRARPDKPTRSAFAVQEGLFVWCLTVRGEAPHERSQIVWAVWTATRLVDEAVVSVLGTCGAHPPSLSSFLTRVLSLRILALERCRHSSKKGSICQAG